MSQPLRPLRDRADGSVGELLAESMIMSGAAEADRELR